MVSVGARAYMGSEGCAPSVVQGQSPWSGGQGAKPPEVENIMTVETPTFPLYFTCFLSFLAINCDIKIVGNRYYNAS